VTVDHVPRTTCAVPEKGKVFRHFVTSPNLQKRIIVYVNDLRNRHIIGDPSKFFMFNIHDPKQPASEGLLGTLLNETATKACVPIHVHAHAFRHTLVGKLMQTAGNDLSTVSKFMGHKSSDTTSRSKALLPTDAICNGWDASRHRGCRRDVLRHQTRNQPTQTRSRTYTHTRSLRRLGCVHMYLAVRRFLSIR